MALGTVITVAAAYFPARRGARVDPVQALRETATETAPAGHGRTIAGLAVLAVGLVIAVWAAVGGNANLFIGAIPLVVIAAVVLGPSVVRPLGRVLAAPLVRTGSITAELARDNASRNPKRTASTSLTLMIGVALIATAAMFAATLSSLIAGDLEEELLADHVVEINSNLTFVGAGLDPAVASNIAAIDGVDAAVGVRDSFAEIDGSFTPVTGATTADLALVVDLEVVDGTVTGLGADEVAVSVDDADDEGLAVGDQVTVRFQQGAASLTVAGIYDRGDQLMGSWLVDNAALDAHLPRSLDTRILIRADRADAALLAGDRRRPGRQSHGQRQHPGRLHRRPGRSARQPAHPALCAAGHVGGGGAVGHREHDVAVDLRAHSGTGAAASGGDDQQAASPDRPLRVGHHLPDRHHGLGWASASSWAGPPSTPSAWPTPTSPCPGDRSSPSASPAS